MYDCFTDEVQQSSTGSIVGIVFGIFGAIAIIIIVSFLIWR